MNNPRSKESKIWGYSQTRNGLERNLRGSVHQNTDSETTVDYSSKSKFQSMFFKKAATSPKGIIYKTIFIYTVQAGEYSNQLPHTKPQLPKN